MKRVQPFAKSNRKNNITSLLETSCGHLTTDGDDECPLEVFET